MCHLLGYSLKNYDFIAVLIYKGENLFDREKLRNLQICVFLGDNEPNETRSFTVFKGIIFKNYFLIWKKRLLVVFVDL